MKMSVKEMTDHLEQERCKRKRKTHTQKEIQRERRSKREKDAMTERKEQELSARDALCVYGYSGSEGEWNDRTK